MLDVQDAPIAPRKSRATQETVTAKRTKTNVSLENNQKKELFVTKAQTFDIEKPHKDAVVWIHFPGKETLLQLLKCLKNSKIQGKEKDKATQENPIFEIMLMDKTSEEKEEQTFSGLTVETQDKGCCVFIYAKLLAKVYYENREDFENAKTFKIQTNALNSSINTIDSSHSLVLYRLKDEVELCLAAIAPSSSTHMTLPTFTIEETELKGNADVKNGLQSRYDHCVEFSLNELKSVAKYAEDIKCDKVRILLAQVKQDKQKSFLIMQTDHENQFFERSFYSCFEKDDKGSRIVFKNTALSLINDVRKFAKTELNVVYNECFDANLFHMIVMHLSSPEVILQLHQDKPFILRANLGNDQSQITFALAPKQSESDFVFKSNIFV